MDADYLRNTVGQVVAKGCAETIAVAPVDPIHYLSLWLLKYVENAKLVNNLQRERELLFQQQLAKQDKQRQEESSKQEKIQKQNDKINQLRSIQNDPYLLFEECLKAVLEFTGGTSSYVALVLDKPWEPPKKLPESEDEEGVPNDENAEEEEKEEEEMEEGESGEANLDTFSQGNEGDDQGTEGDVKQGGEESSENSERENRKRTKPPKPLNYKKKILLYVAATPNNNFLLNKQLDRKTGPMTFSILLQGLPKLHIANVLYQQGMHFFQGLPLMGAYLTTPVLLNATSSQVVALLCVDTLRKDHAGTGRPFSSDEQEFIAAVAHAAAEVLSTNLPSASGNFSTKSFIKELQEQLQQVEAAHKAESRSGDKKMLETDDAQGGPKPEEDLEEGKTDKGVVPSKEDETDNKSGEDTKDVDEDADVDEQDDAEDNAETENEDEEKLDEDEGQEEAEQHHYVDDSQRQMQEFGNSLKQQQKKVAKLQKHFQKCQTRLEKQAAKLVKLEKQLTRSSGMLNHFCKLLNSVLDIIVKHKEEVFRQIKQCLFPTNTVYRVLKALLNVLGHGDAVINDWTKSRQTLNEEMCTVMRDYSSLLEMDLKKWDLSDIYLDGITEAQLSEEAPIGYLAQQWLLAAKKVAFETMKCKDCKAKSEKAAKDFADVELEQMVAEIDLRVAIDEEKKLEFQVEDLQSKFAKELSSQPTDEVAEQNVDEEGVEE